MDQFSGLAPEQQAIAGVAFLIAMGILAAWSKFRGHREGPLKPKVQEFYASGALYDMGPVKELVGQTGLLVQQQVRTNIHLEAVADSLKHVAELYEAQIEAQETQEEIEQRAQQLFERRLSEERPIRRTTRKKPIGRDPT